MKLDTPIKKGCLLLLLLLPYAVPAHSQALIALLFGKKISTDKLQLGLFLAAQNSFDEPMRGDFLNVGFSIGAYTDIKLGNTDHWMLSNYLVFKSPKGARGLRAADNTFFGPDAINNLPVEIQNLNDVTINRDLTYFEITPLMRYNINPSWAVGFGPCIGFRLLAKDTYTSVLKNEEGDRTGKWDYTTSIKSYINWYDVGLAADVQFRLLKGKGMNFNVRYAQGLTEVYKNTAQKGRNAYLHVGVGIPIGGRQKVADTPNLINNDKK